MFPGRHSDHSKTKASIVEKQQEGGSVVPALTTGTQRQGHLDAPRDPLCLHTIHQAHELSISSRETKGKSTKKRTQNTNKDEYGRKTLQIIHTYVHTFGQRQASRSTLDSGERIQHEGGRVPLEREHLGVAEAVVGLSVHGQVRVLDGADADDLRHALQLRLVGLLLSGGAANGTGNITRGGGNEGIRNRGRGRAGGGGFETKDSSFRDDSTTHMQEQLRLALLNNNNEQVQVSR